MFVRRHYGKQNAPRRRRKRECDASCSDDALTGESWLLFHFKLTCCILSQETCTYNVSTMFSSQKSKTVNHQGIYGRRDTNLYWTAFCLNLSFFAGKNLEAQNGLLSGFAWGAIHNHKMTGNYPLCGWTGFPSGQSWNKTKRVYCHQNCRLKAHASCIVFLHWIWLGPNRSQVGWQRAFVSLNRLN